MLLKDWIPTLNKIYLNSQWEYEKHDTDDPISINKKIRKKYKYEKSWKQIFNELGGEL